MYSKDFSSHQICEEIVDQNDLETEVCGRQVRVAFMIVWLSVQASIVMRNTSGKLTFTDGR